MRPARNTAAIAIIAAGLLGLTACAPAAPQAAADRQTGVDLAKITVDKAAAALVPADITKRGTLIIGVDPTYAPNEFKDKNGDPIGWEIDLLDAAAAKLGLKTDYRVAKFDNIVPSILGEKYDAGLGGYYDTKKRQETLDMVDFFSAGEQFASPVDKPIKTVLDVCGLKVGDQNGGSAPLQFIPKVNAECEANGKPKVQEFGYDTQDEQTAALMLGRLEAMISDSPVTGYAVKLSKGKLVASPIFDQILSGAPVKKNRGTFAEALRSSIESLLKDGTYGQILTYWGVEVGAIDKITINGATE